MLVCGQHLYEARGGLQFRIIAQHRHGDRRGGPLQLSAQLVGNNCRCYPVDVVVFLKVSFIAEFVPDKKGEEGTAGNAYGKAKNIDEGENFMPVDITEGGDKVIVQHSGLISIMLPILVPM